MDFAQWLPRALSITSFAIMGVAAVAGGYLLIVDAQSTWVDRAVGSVLLVAVAYALRSRDGVKGEQIVPAWRPRDRWDVLLPVVFPLWLAVWANDRGSWLVWIGWGLLALAVAVQVAIWLVERHAAAA